MNFRGDFVLLNRSGCAVRGRDVVNSELTPKSGYVRVGGDSPGTLIHGAP